MTELSGRICMINSGESLSKTGSVGRPIEGLDITIVSDDNEVCATGEMGSVLQGAMLLEGYKGLPLKNREVSVNLALIVGMLANWTKRVCSCMGGPMRFFNQQGKS